MHFAVCSSQCAGEGAADDPQLERCSREDLQHLQQEDLHRAAFTGGEFDSVSTAEVQVEKRIFSDLYRVHSLRVHTAAGACHVHIMQQLVL